MSNDNLNSDSAANSTGINNPELTDNLKPTRRAIKDAEQAVELVKQLITQNRDRNTKNGRIMAKYNAEAPYRKCDLEADGLGWKNNFSTKPLGILIDKIAPRFTKAIQGVRYLTSSALPEDAPGSTPKTEAFRSEITKTIRARRGWKNFITELSQENALFGFTAVAWTDEYSWMPRHYRQDEFFIPPGTKQNSEQAQVVALRDDFLLHELFSMIENKSAAVDAGWNIENTVELLNDAVPQDLRKNFSNFSSPDRIYEDMARELNIAASYSLGAKVVTCYHLFATEISGKVSHRIIGGDKLNSLKEVFSRDDRFASMSDAASFFAFQFGNGTMHGSKGIGREVYQMASVLDRARNEVVDRLQLSGKILLQCDEKSIKRFRMSVVGNAILIATGYNVQQVKIDGGVEPFFQMDSYLTSLLDQIAGTVSPKALEGDRVTKAAVDLVAGREEERRDVIIDRFMAQVADMVSTMQRRLCDPKTTDADAKELQKRLLKVMSRAELKQISEQPAAATIADYTEQERQQVVVLCSEAHGNPLYNQKAVEREKITALHSADLAERLLLPDNDPSEQAEQSREQLMENALMIDGRPVGVSLRDNHRLHLDGIYPAIEATIKALINDPGALDILKLFIQHGASHAQMGASMDPTNFKEDLAKFKNYAAGAADVEKHLAAAPPEALAASTFPGAAVPGGPAAPVPQLA